MVNLVRREPFSLFDALFDERFNDFLTRAALPASTAELPSVARARMDVIDQGDRFEVLVDLPGVKKEDIHVTIEGPRVSINAERKSEKQRKDGERVLHSERFAASYARSFELPAEVTEEGAEAKFDDGVLKLVLPKRAPVASKRLQIR